MFTLIFFNKCFPERNNLSNYNYISAVAISDCKPSYGNGITSWDPTQGETNQASKEGSQKDDGGKLYSNLNLIHTIVNDARFCMDQRK